MGGKAATTADSSSKDLRVVGNDAAFGAYSSGNSSVKIDGGTIVAQDALAANESVTKAVLELAGDTTGNALDNVTDIIVNQTNAQLANRQYDNEIFKAFATQTMTQSSNAVGQIASLAETRITDGANLNNRTTMVALAIGGAVLLFATMRGK